MLSCDDSAPIAHPRGHTAHRWVRDRITVVASAVVCGAGAFAGGQAHLKVTRFERSPGIVPPPRTFDCDYTESNGGSILIYFQGGTAVGTGGYACTVACTPTRRRAAPGIALSGGLAWLNGTNDR